MDVRVSVRTASSDEAGVLLSQVKNKLIVQEQQPAAQCTHKRDLRLKFTELPEDTCVETFQEDVLKALSCICDREFAITDVAILEVG